MFHQISYIKGYGAGMRVIDGLIGEELNGLNGRIPPAERRALERLRGRLRAHEQDNENLYTRLVDAEYRKEASEANQDWPGHARSCRVVVDAYLHPQAKDCTCGEAVAGDPDFVAKERILDRA